MKNKKIGFAIAGVASLLMIFGVGISTAAEEKVHISIAAGPAGGSYYPLSVGMSEIIRKNITGAKVDVVNTGGSTENTTMVGAGECEIGITNGDTAYEGFTGTGRYAGRKLPNIRVLYAGIAGGPLHAVVGQASGIKSYAHLKGKKIALGPQGNTTGFLTLELLKHYGIQKQDLRLSYLNFDEGIQALQDGQVDVTTIIGALPLPSVKQLATFGRFAFDLISIEEDKAQVFRKDNPFFNVIKIPAAMYGLGHEVKTLSSTNIVIVNAKLSEDVAYRVTKSIFENLSMMHSAHPSGRAIKLENAAIDYLPMHPGAEKYFREKGIKK